MALYAGGWHWQGAVAAGAEGCGGCGRVAGPDVWNSASHFVLTPSGRPRRTAHASGANDLGESGAAKFDGAHLQCWCLTGRSFRMLGSSSVWRFK